MTITHFMLGMAAVYFVSVKAGGAFFTLSSASLAAAYKLVNLMTG